MDFVNNDNKAKLTKLNFESFDKHFDNFKIDKNTKPNFEIALINPKNKQSCINLKEIVIMLIIAILFVHGALLMRIVHLLK